MVVLLISGYPCSGKTTLANRLKEIYESEGKSVSLISENLFGDRNRIYNEKAYGLEIGNAIKSKIVNDISRNEIIIVDAMNHTKSFRYEIFCVCKENSSRRVLIYLSCNEEMSKERNQARIGVEKYDENVLESIIRIFETPDPSKKWDQPFLLIENSLDFDVSAINACIVSGNQRLVPNQSHASAVNANDNYINELDRITKKVISNIYSLMQQKKLHLLNGKLSINSFVSFGELQNIRKTFLSYVKTNPIKSMDKVESIFYAFIEDSMK